MNPTLSVIITSYKAKPAMVKACMDSIFKSLENQDITFEILHVDAEYQALTKEFASQYPNNVYYLPQEKNIGFSKSCNIGFRKAKGQYILLLNDDIIIVKDAIGKMINYLKKHPNVGIVGPALLNFNGSIQSSIWRTPSLKYLLSSRLPLMKKIHSEYSLKNIDYSQVRKVGWVLGAAFMVRKKDLEKIGYMDENIFLYLEDSDLCRRFWDAGYKVIYYPEAKMYHFHMRASAQGGILQNIFWLFAFYKRQHFKSMLYYLKKYKGQKTPEEKYNIKYA